MPNLLPRVSGFALCCLWLGGCGGGGFDPGGVLESRAVRLDGEQAVLSAAQVECGVQNDLWIISPMGEERSLGRLTQKGRDLQFGDDVQIVQPASWVQLRGSFSLHALQVANIQDSDAYTKVAEAKVGVRIDHKCFQDSLPVLMGIRKGQFSSAANVSLRFKLDNEWQFDQVVH